MSAQVIDRLQNLIRVVSHIPDDKFDIKCWFNPGTGCGCAIGHSLQDEYFISQKFKPNVSDAHGIANFFDIDIKQALALFYPNVDRRQSRQDIVAMLRVIVMEKIAQDIGHDVVETYLRISREAPIDSSINADELESV